MNKLLFFILLGSLSLAQEKENKIIFQDYPKDQQYYMGGQVQFYKELHQVFIDKKLKPCDNKNELYTAWVVINPDASIVIPKESEVKNINDIRCTYNLVRDSFKYLNNWRPATVDGKSVAAIVYISIFPDILFDNYKEAYKLEDYISDPEFAEGIDAFRQKFVNIASIDRFRIRNIKKIIINFSVSKNGEVEDIKLDKSSGNKKFDDMLINSVRKIEGKWIPGMIHGVPVRSHFRFPIILKSN
ncbi:TPA: energy transducer TonB [Elizabethkingia anophelis]